MSKGQYDNVVVTYGRSTMKRVSRSAQRFKFDQVVFAEDYHWVFVPKQDSVRDAYTSIRASSPNNNTYRTLVRSKKYFIFTSDVQESRSAAVDLMFAANFEGKAPVGCLILEDEFMFFWIKERM